MIRRKIFIEAEALLITYSLLRSFFKISDQLSLARHLQTSPCEKDNLCSITKIIVMSFCWKKLITVSLNLLERFSLFKEPLFKAFSRDIWIHEGSIEDLKRFKKEAGNGSMNKLIIY